MYISSKISKNIDFLYGFTNNSKCLTSICFSFFSKKLKFRFTIFVTCSKNKLTYRFKWD